MQRLLIGDVLERLHADPAIGVEEAFAGIALLQIEIDHALDRVGDFMLAETGAHDLADGGVFRARAAQLQLVEFHAFLVHAQDADMTGMVMAAGIDAAGNLDLEFADIMLAFQIGETLGDGLRDRDRAGIGEIAIIQARAGNDVGDQPGIGRGQIQRLKAGEDRGQVLLPDMRQHQILFMGDADFAEAEFVHQVGHGVHLVGAGVARNLARWLSAKSWRWHGRARDG